MDDYIGPDRAEDGRVFVVFRIATDYDTNLCDIFWRYEAAQAWVARQARPYIYQIKEWRIK